MTTKAGDHQIFKLPDGRTLGFAEYGVPDGHPLLYFHGFPACRLEAAPMDSLARKHGFRLIALDRPGFGLSTPQPHRRFPDWSGDVQAFADGMDISRFGVFGLSGGGPYALACARFLPRGRLTGVGLFASGPPWAAGRHHMTWVRRFVSVWSTYSPGSLRVALDLFVGVWKWIASTRFITARVDRWLEAAKAKKNGERGAVEDQDVAGWMQDRPVSEKREALIDMLLREPYLQGTGATIHEAMLLSAPDWGFNFEDVEFDEIKMWHGVEDKGAPIAAIRWLKERLPHCTLHEFEGETHYSMWLHLEEALKELVPREKAW